MIRAPGTPMRAQGLPGAAGPEPERRLPDAGGAQRRPREQSRCRNRYGPWRRAMRKVIFALLLGLVWTGAAAPAHADPPAAGFAAVQGWNASAFAAVRALRAGDADAARWYAMLNVAMYDAVN